MSTGSTGLSDWESPSEGKGGAKARASPWEGTLLVPPAVACQMLNISHAHLYKILPELESYCEGRARRITVRSIQDRIARRIAAGVPNKPRRGRPRKNPLPRAAAITEPLVEVEA
jgi:hypothetical protein